MNESIIFDIFKKSYQQREQYVSQNHIEAYRLYDQEDPFLPVAIDIYQNNAVIHIFGIFEHELFAEMEKTLRELLKIQKFFYKNRTKGDLDMPKSSPHTMTVQEYGHSFSLNLSDYLDTGLFLDHRETRKWIEAQSKNKIILNTFAYTGSFSIYAAAGGAEKTYSVDLSKTYCEWIKKNLELNHLPLEKNWVYKMDTFEFFRYARKKNLTFDIIIIDPPSFSRNKGETFSVQKDHPQLINEAVKLLKKGGFVLFSNNKIDFQLSIKKLISCKIEDFQKKSMPKDFVDPETHHCYIIRPA